jgi:hypothetical protein
MHFTRKGKIECRICFRRWEWDSKKTKTLWHYEAYVPSLPLKEGHENPVAGPVVPGHASMVGEELGRESTGPKMCALCALSWFCPHSGLFEAARSGFDWPTVRTEGRRTGGLRFKFYADRGARCNVLLNFQRSRWASPEADKSFI